MSDIAALRARIAALDGEIVALVAERVRLARDIGQVKREAGSATLDPGREAAVIRNAVLAGRERGLSEEGVRALFWTLVGLCREAQLPADR